MTANELERTVKPLLGKEAKIMTQCKQKYCGTVDSLEDVIDEIHDRDGDPPHKRVVLSNVRLHNGYGETWMDVAKLRDHVVKSIVGLGT